MLLRNRITALLAAALLALGATACDWRQEDSEAPDERQETGEGAEPEGGVGEEGLEEEEGEEEEEEGSD